MALAVDGGMTIIDAMTQDLLEQGIITSLSHWTGGRHERTYIRASGYNPSYRGCKTHQLYWDHVRGCLVNESGPGRTPRDYDDAVDAIAAAFAEVL